MCEPYPENTARENEGPNKISKCLLFKKTLQFKTVCKDHRAYVTQLKQQKLERRPMPNVMAALPNIGGALCSTPQGLADAHY